MHLTTSVSMIIIRRCEARSKLVFLLACFLLISQPLTAQSYKIRDEAKLSFTLDVITNDIKFLESEEGKTQVIFSGSDFIETSTFTDTNSSIRTIPVKHFFIAVPQNSTIEIGTVSYGKYLHVLSQVDKSNLSAESKAPRRNTSIAPQVLASLIRYQQIAGQRVALIEVNPVQIDPDSNLLWIHPIISLKISFRQVGYESKPVETVSNFSEGAVSFLKNRIVNYRQMEKWNGTKISLRLGTNVPKKQLKMMSSSASFPDYSKPWLKLLVIKNGIVSVQGKDLIASGVDISSINPNTFKLYRNSVELPLHLPGEEDGIMNENDELKFLGEVNKPKPYPIINESTGKIRNWTTPFYDDYSDTAVYWLTWGGAIGKRYPIETVSPTNGSVSEKQKRILRAEYDGFYHPGVNPYITERTFTEGWHWRSFIVQNTLTDDSDIFEIPSEGALQTGSAKIRLRLIGVSQDFFSSGEHRIECRIGNTVLGEFVFFNRADTTAEFSFPANLLSKTTTPFRITLKRNLNPQTVTNIVNLDAIEIEYESDFSFQKIPTFNLEQRHQAVQGEGKDVILTNRFGTGISGMNQSDSTWLNGIFLFEDKARFFAKSGKTYIIAENEDVIKPTIRKPNAEFLKSETSGADYLIITADELKSEAQRLAALRSSKDGGSYRTKVVSVESIYDEFNYGIYSPESVKEYIKDAFSRWLIKPQYIVLLGGGNWDSKHRIPQSSQKKPLIPVYGNPVSDIWFVSFNNDSLQPFINLPQCTIGRIPAQSRIEAKAYLDKLEEHLKVLEGSAETWHKRFLFINGGFTRNEQILFRQNSNFLADNFIRNRPIGGIADTVYRDDQNPFVNYQLSERLEESFNKGSSIVNFIGHAGSQTWDLALNDPKSLRNRGKYPIVMSWTCHTGRFAEPYNRTFGEQFVLQPSSGSLIFFGTSGWGFPSTDLAMMRGAYRAVADTLFQINSVWSGAYQELLNLTPFWEPIRVGTLDQYNILGDPAFQIPLKKLPDYFFSSNALEMMRDNSPIRAFIENESVYLRVIIENKGLSPVNQFVSVRFYDQVGTSPKILLGDTLIFSPRFIDTLVFSMRFTGAAGEHQLSAIINETSEVVESNTRNNEASVRFTVIAENQITVLPQNFSVVPFNNPVLSVITEGQFSPEEKYRFEIDTSATFSSTLLEISPDIISNPFITQWRPQSALTLNRPYYWRVGKVVNEAVQNWKTSVVTFGASTGVETVWRLSGNLLSNLRLNSTELIDGSLRISNGIYPIRLRSVGSRGGLLNIRYEITIGNLSSFASYGANRRGLNVIVIDTSIGLTPIVNRNFDLWEIQNNDPLANEALNELTGLIENLKPHQILFVALMDAIPPVDYPPISGLIELFRSLGSRRYAQLKVGESWVFAGSKNRDVYLEDWGSRCSQSSDSGCDSLFRSARAEGTLRIPNREGAYESEKIGKASQWLDLRVQQSSPAGASIRTTVYGLRSSGAEDSLFTLNETQSVLPLSNLDPNRYSSIRLKGDLTRGTSSQNSNPALQTLTVRYRGTPDVAISSAALSFSDTTIQEGKPNLLTLEMRNLGTVTVDSVKVSILQRELQRGRSDSLLHFTVKNLSPNETRNFTASLSTLGKRGRIQVSIFVDEEGNLNEVSKLNNSAEKRYTILTDTLAPEVALTVDGRRIRDGDLISAKPTIVYQITDRSPIPISDTSLFQIRLNGRRIFFNNPSISFSSVASTNQTTSITYMPELEDGIYTLQATIRDASGNIADSASSSVRFTVQNDFAIEGFYNYPNPFSYQTQFAFRQTGDGSERIEEIKLRIYTISGRLLKEINLIDALKPIGLYSLIPWDGRDEDGDLLANGTYLYRLSVVTNKQTITKTEKLSILR